MISPDIAGGYGLGCLQPGLPSGRTNQHGLHAPVQDPVPPGLQLPVAGQEDGVRPGPGLEGTDDQREGSQSHPR